MELMDKLRAVVLDRAKFNSWFGANGKLTKRGRDGVIDYLVGAAMAADLLGHKTAYNRISMQAFLCGAGRADEFLAEKPVPPAPTKEELESLSFPDEHSQPDCAACKEDRAHEFPDGSLSVVCTNFARQVKALYPHHTRVMGFACKDNPVDHHEISTCEGHDFAVVSDRYIVDYWLRDVVGDVGPVVFDLQDVASHDAIVHRYGDRTKWQDLT